MELEDLAFVRSADGRIRWHASGWVDTREELQELFGLENDDKNTPGRDHWESRMMLKIRVSGTCEADHLTTGLFIPTICGECGKDIVHLEVSSGTTRNSAIDSV